MNWQPAASAPLLRARAEMLACIRSFFADRQVLEVETPLLCSHGGTEPAIEPLQVSSGTAVASPRFLQTSPEYAMKRLLAAGSGSIYQIAKAFRDGEVGRRHNPEFTLLEWYRPGYNHHQLMAEVADLVLACSGTRPVTYASYRSLFMQHLALDPLLATTAELEARARSELDVGSLVADRDTWLDLLMSHIIEPQLPRHGLVFVYDYPPAQASLARLGECDGELVAHRFELYIDGIELANGYWELSDAKEQRRRFIADNARRAERGLPEYPLDEYLLSALEAGLPDCAGVAMGLDRLLMVNSGTDDIRRVLAFDWARS